MQTKLLCAMLCSLSVLAAQSVVWSYYAPTGGTYAHFRSTRTIEDIDGDLHEDVIAVAENDTLYCFSGVSGTPIWRFAADPCYVERGLIAVPDLDGDTVADVVLGTIWGTRSVFAISGVDGTVIWMYDTHEYGQGGWVYEVAEMEDMTGDTVPDILATAGGPDAKRAYLFNGATGAKIWEDSAGYACFGVRPVGDVNGDSVTDVAVSTGNSQPSAYRLRFLNGSNGSLIRQVALPASGLTVVPIGDINSDTIPDVACGTGNGNILAISGADGSILWSMSAGGMVWDLNLMPDVDGSGHPELLPSGVVLSSFLCVDAADGSVLWSTPAVDQVFVNVAVPDINEDGIPDVVGGTGYNNGVLYALNGGSGAVLWQYATGSPVESAYWIEDISGNGIPDILAGLRNGWLYAMSDGFVPVMENSATTIGCMPLVSRFGALEISHSIPLGRALRIDIYSTLGRQMKELRMRCDRNPLNIDVSDLSSGVYYARVRTDGSDEFLKFVVFD